MANYSRHGHWKNSHLSFLYLSGALQKKCSSPALTGDGHPLLCGSKGNVVLCDCVTSWPPYLLSPVCSDNWVVEYRRKGICRDFKICLSHISLQAIVSFSVISSHLEFNSAVKLYQIFLVCPLIDEELVILLQLATKVQRLHLYGGQNPCPLC